MRHVALRRFAAALACASLQQLLLSPGALVVAAAPADRTPPNAIHPDSAVYFDTELFRGHSNVTRLLSLLNLSLPGLEPVRLAAAKNDVFLASNRLLVYYRKRIRRWRLIKHTSGWMKSVAIADDALNHTVTKLGGASKPRRVVFPATGIAWTANPFWASEKDAEWGWALHRQPFWMSMAWAYQSTKNEQYALEWRRQLLDWIEKNPRDPRLAACCELLRTACTTSLKAL